MNKSTIIFIIKRNYIFIGNSQKCFFNENSFYMTESKLFNTFYSLLNQRDNETFLSNDNLKLFSYNCEEITTYIREPNMIERETKLIENFIYELFAGTSIYHDYILLSKETESLNNSIIEDGISQSIAEKIFGFFIRDLDS